MDILRVRVDELSAYREPLDARHSEWAGRGLTAKLLSNEVPPGCSALGRANKLIIANGLLAGTRSSSTGRLSIGAKSPLTLGIKESNTGGVAGDTMARLGLRAIVLEGQAAPGPLHLLRVSDSAAELVRADDLRGLGTYALCDTLYERYGRNIAVICIGPAGERKLPVAGVAVNDADGVPSRYAGRGGMGAVMGAKGIKAIILDDVPGQVPVADETALRTARKRYNAALKDHPVTGRGFPLFGTVMALDVVRALGGLPVKNFSRGDVEGEHPELSADGIRQTILDRGGEGNPTHACMPGCVIRCSNVFPDEGGKAIVAPLEYESLVLLGSNLGIYSVDGAAHLNYLCNDYGIDTMETGVALGVAMEAGVLPFGDHEGAVKLLGEIAGAELMGRVLGQGAAIAGRVLGVERVPTVKGQGISAYDPRAVKSLGVTYATSPMGADHTAGYTLNAKVDQHSPEGQVQISRNSQVIRAGLDAVGICNFAMSAMIDAPDILVDLINTVHGTSHGPDLLTRLGSEVLRMERAFNARAGFTAAHDALPEFMTTERLPPFDLTFDVPQEELAHIFDGIDDGGARCD